MHHNTPTTTNCFGSARGSRRGLVAHAASVLTILAAAAFATFSLTAVPALADDCPNAALRAQNNSTQLPDCRAYELVSPPFKEGFVAVPSAFAGDGRLAYRSNANIAGNGNGAGTAQGGNQYIATRSTGGWATTALAPGSGYAMGLTTTVAQAFSSDLDSSVFLMSLSGRPVAQLDLYLRTAGGVFTRIGPAFNPDKLPPSAPGGSAVETRTLKLNGASDDLSHFIFSQEAAGAWPGAVVNGSYNLYEYVGTGNDRPRLVSVDNTGQQIGPGCESAVGDRAESTYRAMSIDGRVIFFTAGCSPASVWARVNGTTTIAVAASQCTRAPSDPEGACNGADASAFEGASADGTRVYFTTSQQLVDGDTDSTKDLYECDMPSGTPAPIGPANPCPDLREVSGAASDANVQGVTRISDDGSRAYFVATGVLASNHGVGGTSAVDGDDNLYVWQRDAGHPGGQTTFVGKLDPGDGNLWGPEQGSARLAQSTDDGRYLMFASHAQLIDSGPQADPDTALDIYRYDAETGGLVRVSTDVDGRGGDSGDDAEFTAQQYISPVPTNGPRTALTDDGQTIAFSTSEALSPADTNGSRDVYMWDDGRVSLVSSGQMSLDGSILATFAAWVSPSGRDLYFQTTARLTAADVDSQIDIYDARLDGGFDQSTPSPCSGDTCQGGRSAPPPVAHSGSSTSTGQGGAPQTTPSFVVRALTASQRKRIASTGKVSLSVTTTAPGTLTATATATIAKRSSTIGSVQRRVAAAGTTSVSLTLAKKARAALKATGKLSVKVLVRQSNVSNPRTVSLHLTRAKGPKKTLHRTARHAVVMGGRS